MLLDWMKRRGLIAHNSPAVVEGGTVAPHERAMSGEYLSLFKYLDKRYANVVVLTFAEIEDLLGFTLPDLARLRTEWWTDAGPKTARPRYSDSWILAHRSARPNLSALTVVFERAG